MDMIEVNERRVELLEGRDLTKAKEAATELAEQKRRQAEECPPEEPANEVS